MHSVCVGHIHFRYELIRGYANVISTFSPVGSLSSNGVGGGGGGGGRGEQQPTCFTWFLSSTFQEG